MHTHTRTRTRTHRPTDRPIDRQTTDRETLTHPRTHTTAPTQPHPHTHPDEEDEDGRPLAPGLGTSRHRPGTGRHRRQRLENLEGPGCRTGGPSRCCRRSWPGAAAAAASCRTAHRACARARAHACCCRHHYALIEAESVPCQRVPSKKSGGGGRERLGRRAHGPRCFSFWEGEGRGLSWFLCGL